LPLITYGSGNLTDPTSWYLAEIAKSPNWVYNKYLHGHGEIAWKIRDGLTLAAGYNWVQYRNVAITFSRSDGTSGFLSDVMPGSYSTNVSRISALRRFEAPGLPAGNASQWLVPDFDAAAQALRLYDMNFMNSVT